MRKLSYSAAWDDAVALLRAHAPLIVALAGVFLFLPGLLAAHFLPPPEPADPARLLPEMLDYARANAGWLLLANLVNMVGTLAILQLIFARAGTSVGGAIVGALLLLPFYFVAGFISFVLIALGLLLLIVPGLYVMSRLAPLGPVVVAESRRNPIEAIGRSFAVTRGNGWRIVGLMMLIGIAGFILVRVSAMLVGIVFTLILGADLGTLLALIVGTAARSALVVLFVLLYAAVYRLLSGARDSGALD